MELTTAATRVYKISEIQAYLKEFELDHTLNELSLICTYAYTKEHNKYLNWIQTLPAVFNAVGMFCEGDLKTFDLSNFQQLCIMVSSIDLPDASRRGVIDDIYKVVIKASRHYENVHYVFGRIGFVFDWIDKNKSDLGFEKVTKIQLQDFLIAFFGAHSLGASGGHLPIYNPEAFFKESTYTPEEIAKLTKMIDENMSLTSKQFKENTLNNLAEKKKDFDEAFTAFEDKPFLKVKAGYLLIAPHFGVNELISICAKFYFLSYSASFQSEASKHFGLGFEDYISSLFEMTTTQKRYLREPPYKGTSNKGIDLVDIRSGKSPLLIEIHKAVVYKTVIYDFNIKDFEGFLKKAIVEKFEQIFKWLKSHDLNFNGVNLKYEMSCTQMVVCMSQSVPLLQFDEPSEILLRLVNESWKRILGDVQPLKSKNIYVLGSYDVELLTAISKAKKIRPSTILFDYKKYVSKTPQYFLNPTKGIEIRKSFSSWIMDEHDCKKHKNSFCVEEGNKAIKKLSTKLKK